MKKIFVLRAPWLTDVHIALLRRLLQAIGFELVLLAPEEASAVGSDDVVLVMISAALDADVTTCSGIGAAQSRGAAVVGVWPPESNWVSYKIPSVIARTGSGTTTCDGPGLRKVTDPSGAPVWLDPRGQRFPEQPLPRGGC